jgi:hypothetical protein
MRTKRFAAVNAALVAGRSTSRSLILVMDLPVAPDEDDGALVALVFLNVRMKPLKFRPAPHESLLSDINRGVQPVRLASLACATL